MNIIIFLCILILIYIFWVNLHLQENLENINCIGGWLPWQKTGEKTNCGSGLKPLLVENERRTYKIIKPVNTGGIDCEKNNGDTEDISCNKPKPDDCLVIRARYYGTENPTVDQMKEKCNMGNCIPAKNITANCDGNLILIGAGSINEKVGKRCPWICDNSGNNGDGINTCLYNSHCSKCSPKNLFDRTNCGNNSPCPNPLAEDGCGIKRGVDDYVLDINNNEEENLEITEDKKSFNDYSKYIKPKKKGKTYNKYNLQKPDPPPLYKALYDYIPFNSMHSFF